MVVTGLYDAVERGVINEFGSDIFFCSFDFLGLLLGKEREHPVVQTNIVPLKVSVSLVPLEVDAEPGEFLEALSMEALLETSLLHLVVHGVSNLREEVEAFGVDVLVGRLIA